MRHDWCVIIVWIGIKNKNKYKNPQICVQLVLWSVRILSIFSYWAALRLLIHILNNWAWDGFPYCFCVLPFGDYIQVFMEPFSYSIRDWNEFNVGRLEPMAPEQEKKTTNKYEIPESKKLNRTNPKYIERIENASFSHHFIT